MIVATDAGLIIHLSLGSGFFLLSIGRSLFRDLVHKEVVVNRAVLAGSGRLPWPDK